MCSLSDELLSELKLNGFHESLSFNDDIFLYDTWEQTQALAWLVGINSAHFDADGNSIIETMYGKTYSSDTYGETITNFHFQLHRLQQMWDPEAHPQRNSPKHYIEWALTKETVIPWLEYVKSRGYLSVNEPLGIREKNNLLKLIAALKELALHNEVSFQNQAELITFLGNKYEGMEGFSKSKLEDLFPKAKRLLDAS